MKPHQSVAAIVSQMTKEKKNVILDYLESVPFIESLVNYIFINGMKHNAFQLCWIEVGKYCREPSTSHSVTQVKMFKVSLISVGLSWRLKHGDHTDY